MASLGDMVVRIVGDATEFNKSIDAAHSKFQNATSNFQKLGANLTKFVTLPILGIGAAAVKSAADMEMQEAAFTTLLGSAEKAKVLLGDIAELAAKTPFQMPDLAEASRTMLAFGISSEKVLPNLRMLGDIAGGDATKLKSLTLAFSQIQSTGRLMGQDLLQLINAGFNPLTIIAQKTGKSMADLKKEMEQGAISADMVADAFQTATSEGGLFFGGMERASKTLTGQFSTLMDDMKALGRSIGEILLPTIKDIVAGASEWVKNFTSLDEEAKKLILIFAGLVASIGPLISVSLQLIKILPAIKAGMLAISANPTIIALSAAVAALYAVSMAAVAIGVGMKKAAAESNALKVALEGVATIEDYLLAIKKQEAEVSAAERALSVSPAAFKKAMEDRLAREREKLRVVRENYRYALLEIEAKKRAAEEAARKADEEAKAEARLAAEEAKRFSTAIPATTVIIENEEEITKEKEKQVGLVRESRNLVAVETDEIVSQTELRIAGNERIAQSNQEIHDAKMEQLEAERVASQYIYGQINSLIDMVGDNEIARIEQSELSEKEKAIAIAKAKRKQAIWDKAQGVVDIGINTAVAITKALPNVILAAAIGALGAAQAAAVLAKPLPEIPTFAAGGVVMPQPGGVQALVAEAGVPEAIIPLDRFDEMLNNLDASSGGMTHLVVNLDSRPLLDKIFEATRNRTVLISAGAVV